MSDTPIQQTRNKLSKIYGVGILSFAAVVGSITLLAKFLTYLSWT